MRTAVGAIALFACLATLPIALPAAGESSGATDGRALFAARCAACHTIGRGRLVGPDLEGVTKRRPQRWLIDFITAPQRMIESGDPEAAEVFEAFNRIPMPPAGISKAEILAVLDYIESQTPPAPAEPGTSAAIETSVAGSPGSSAEPGAAPQSPGVPSELAAHGRNLFDGTARFARGGPACNACHHVAMRAVMGGGSLAVELTDISSRLPEAGIAAILAQPPFPVMEAAYAGRPLEEPEIRALTAFLGNRAHDREVPASSSPALMLMTSGLLGSAFVYGLCAVLWRDRKKASVNQDVFDRQIRSS